MCIAMYCSPLATHRISKTILRVDLGYGASKGIVIDYFDIHFFYNTI